SRDEVLIVVALPQELDTLDDVEGRRPANDAVDSGQGTVGPCPEDHALPFGIRVQTNQDKPELAGGRGHITPAESAAGNLPSQLPAGQAQQFRLFAKRGVQNEAVLELALQGPFVRGRIEHLDTLLVSIAYGFHIADGLCASVH